MDLYNEYTSSPDDIWKITFVGWLSFKKWIVQNGHSNAMRNIAMFYFTHVWNKTVLFYFQAGLWSKMLQIWDDLVKLVFCNRKPLFGQTVSVSCLQIWFFFFLEVFFDWIDLRIYWDPLNPFRGHGELWTWLPALVEVAILKLRGNRRRWRQQWWWGKNGRIVIKMERFDRMGRFG